MKNNRLILSAAIMINLIAGTLNAQDTPGRINLMIDFGLQFNNRNVAAISGVQLGVGNHFATGFFASTDPIGYQEVCPAISLEGAIPEKAYINHGIVYGLNLKYYSNTDRLGIIFGAGIYRGSYTVNAFSKTEKNNPARSSLGGNIMGPSPEIIADYHEVVTANSTFGWTGEFGYLFPLRTGRLEFSVRTFSHFYQEDHFEIYHQGVNSSTKEIAVKNHFRKTAVNIQVKYVLPILF